MVPVKLKAVRALVRQLPQQHAMQRQLLLELLEAALLVDSPVP
jgi:hypothetical protein